MSAPALPMSELSVEEGLAEGLLGRRAPRQSRSRHMVEQVLRATADVLVDKGRVGLNTNAVALRAGVSVGAIYQYFPDKAALLHALRERHLQAMGQALQEAWLALAPTSLAEAVQARTEGLFAAYALQPVLTAELDADAWLLGLPPDGGEEAETPWAGGLPTLAGQAPGVLWQHWCAVLASHADQLVQHDLALAGWTSLQIMGQLARAAQAVGPQGAGMPGFDQAALLTQAQGAALAYLCGTPQVSGCP